MLSDTIRHEILEEAAACESRRVACMDALKLVQRHHGWVSDEHLREVAAVLDMSAEELDGVATFFNLIRRRPVGRHVILICSSVSCWIMGYERLLKGLQEKLGIALGETTGDDRFTLLANQCLGACDHAPALMIDDDLYHDVDPEQLDEVLARYV